MKCDKKCPVNVNPPPCCVNCRAAREDFVEEKNRDLWDEVRGFWSYDGCKLPREDMPVECKTYDCKAINWLIEVSWTGEEWAAKKAMELESGFDILIGKRNGNSSGTRREPQ